MWTDLFVWVVCNSVYQRWDRALFGFPNITAEMLTSRQTAEEYTHTTHWLWHFNKFAEHDGKWFCAVTVLAPSDDTEQWWGAGGAAALPGRQLVDVTAAVFSPDDDFVCSNELSSGPWLVIVTRHWAEQRVVPCIKHLTHTSERERHTYVAVQLGVKYQVHAVFS